jgi:hypothetical protein
MKKQRKFTCQTVRIKAAKLGLDTSKTYQNMWYKQQQQQQSTTTINKNLRGVYPGFARVFYSNSDFGLTESDVAFSVL